MLRLLIFLLIQLIHSAAFPNGLEHAAPDTNKLANERKLTETAQNYDSSNPTSVFASKSSDEPPDETTNSNEWDFYLQNPKLWPKIIFWTLTAIGILLVVTMLLSIVIVLGAYRQKNDKWENSFGIQSIDTSNTPEHNLRKLSFYDNLRLKVSLPKFKNTNQGLILKNARKESQISM